MTPDQFAKAKEVFIELLDKSEVERNSIISDLEQADAETAKEVKSLLSNHPSITILEKRDSLFGSHVMRFLIPPAQGLGDGLTSICWEVELHSLVRSLPRSFLEP